MNKDPLNLFENAFTYASIGMAIVSLEGKWLKVNSALTKMFGYSEQEFLENDFQKLTHPEDLQVDLKYVSLLMERKIESYQLEKRYVRKDGELLWGLLSVSLITDEDLNPLFFISQIQNISALKKAEVDLIQKNRVEEKLKLTIQLAHEVNNPLTIIDLSVAKGLLLTSEDERLAVVANEFNRIKSASRRICDLVKNLDSSVSNFPS